jgi:hypothetical protein
MPFYQNQIAAGNEIISLFTDGDRGYRWDRGLDSNEIIDRTIQLQLQLQKSFWNVLAAEMQSGKTNTYLWVAFEMLRIGEIDNIYIICGSSSKKLKEQLQNDYDDALDDYIDEMERIGINIDTRRIIKNKIKNTKKIYFSNDLSKIPAIPNNTLLIWVFKTNEFADIGIKENDIFIDTRVLNSDNIPRTTGIECFSHRHKLINEDQTITEMNGRQPSDLPIETSTDEELMKNELSVRIKVSLEYSSQFSRKIESAKSDDNKWIGIILTPEIYDSIKKGGEIYKHMLREYKVKLNPIKSKGRQPIYEDGKIRLIKIEW